MTIDSDPLGRPLVQAESALPESGLPYSFLQTKAASRYYRTAQEKRYIVRIRPGECTWCEQQVYSDSVNAAVAELYGAQHEVK